MGAFDYGIGKLQHGVTIKRNNDRTSRGHEFAVESSDKKRPNDSCNHPLCAVEEIREVRTETNGNSFGGYQDCADNHHAQDNGKKFESVPRRGGKSQDNVAQEQEAGSGQVKRSQDKVYRIDVRHTGQPRPSPSDVENQERDPE